MYVSRLRRSATRPLVLSRRFDKKNADQRQASREGVWIREPPHHRVTAYSVFPEYRGAGQGAWNSMVKSDSSSFTFTLSL